MNHRTPGRAAAAAALAACLLGPVALLAPASAGTDADPQALPLSVADPGNTGTTVDGDVKPVPEKFIAATDVTSLDLAVAMLTGPKGKKAVKTLVVTYRMGDVLPADTKGMKHQSVEIFLHIPNDDDTYSYNMFQTKTYAPKRVGFYDGPGFGDGEKCGYARTSVKKDVIRQFIPMRRCVGANHSDDAIASASIELKPGAKDPSGYRVAWNDMFHTGPLSYDLP